MINIEDKLQAIIQGFESWFKIFWFYTIVYLLGFSVIKYFMVLCFNYVPSLHLSYFSMVTSALLFYSICVTILNLMKLVKKNKPNV